MLLEIVVTALIKRNRPHHDHLPDLYLPGVQRAAVKNYERGDDQGLGREGGLLDDLCFEVGVADWQPHSEALSEGERETKEF